MYTPKTGEKCSCRRGVERDNCPDCEGTGQAVDFRAIRSAVQCSQCNGAGEFAYPGDGLRTTKCAKCKGQGFIPITK